VVGMKNRVLSAFGSIAVLGAILGAAGCSEELGPESMPVTRVSGSVSEGGRPLSHGWVEFFPVDGTIGNLRSAQLQPDGSFEASGVAVGQNLVRLVNAGVRKELGLFTTFRSPIRRFASSGTIEPVRIELVDEAIQFQSTVSRRAISEEGR
jgi:hypothetical protein